MRICAAFAVLVALAGHPDSIPFEETRAGLVVEATLNGRGPFRLIVDTGSSHSVISDTVARAIGAPTVAKTVVVTAIGQDSRPVVRVDRMALGPALSAVEGPLIACELFPSVISQDTLDASGRVQGIIGQDALAAHRFTLDFRRRRIELVDAPLERGGSALPMTFEDGRYLVELPQGRTTLRLVPDSGAQGLVLFESQRPFDAAQGRPFDGAQGRPLPPMTMTAGRVELATLTARRDVRQARLPQLIIGPLVWRDVPVVVLERIGPDSGADGLLPLHVFERVTFDGPQRLIVLQGQG